MFKYAEECVGSGDFSEDQWAVSCSNQVRES